MVKLSWTLLILMSFCAGEPVVAGTLFFLFLGVQYLMKLDDNRGIFGWFARMNAKSRMENEAAWAREKERRKAVEEEREREEKANRQVLPGSLVYRNVPVTLDCGIEVSIPKIEVTDRGVFLVSQAYPSGDVIAAFARIMARGERADSRITNRWAHVITGLDSYSLCCGTENPGCFGDGTEAMEAESLLSHIEENVEKTGFSASEVAEALRLKSGKPFPASEVGDSLWHYENDGGAFREKFWGDFDGTAGVRGLEELKKRFSDKSEFELKEIIRTYYYLRIFETFGTEARYIVCPVRTGRTGRTAGCDMAVLTENGLFFIDVDPDCAQIRLNGDFQVLRDGSRMPNRMISLLETSDSFCEDLAGAGWSAAYYPLVFYKKNPASEPWPDYSGRRCVGAGLRTGFCKTESYRTYFQGNPGAFSGPERERLFRDMKKLFVSESRPDFGGSGYQGAVTELRTAGPSTVSLERPVYMRRFSGGEEMIMDFDFIAAGERGVFFFDDFKRHSPFCTAGKAGLMSRILEREGIHADIYAVSFNLAEKDYKSFNMVEGGMPGEIESERKGVRSLLSTGDGWLDETGAYFRTRPHGALDPADAARALSVLSVAQVENREEILADPFPDFKLENSFVYGDLKRHSQISDLKEHLEGLEPKKRKGTEFEYRCLKRLKEDGAFGMDALIISSALMSSVTTCMPSSCNETDLLAVSRYGVFAIECKSWSGDLLFAPEITDCRYNGEYKMNPLRQNLLHCINISADLKEQGFEKPEVQIVNVVVFDDACSLRLREGMDSENSGYKVDESKKDDESCYIKGLNRFERHVFFSPGQLCAWARSDVLKRKPMPEETFKKLREYVESEYAKSYEKMEKDIDGRNNRDELVFGIKSNERRKKERKESGGMYGQQRME